MTFKVGDRVKLKEWLSGSEITAPFMYSTYQGSVGTISGVTSGAVVSVEWIVGEYNPAYYDYDLVLATNPRLGEVTEGIVL